MICSEGYVLVGEKIWSLVGHLSPKDKTQLEIFAVSMSLGGHVEVENEARKGMAG